MAVPVTGSLESLGCRGTGLWEPRGIGRVEGVDLRGLFGRFGTDDAVAVRGVVLDASLAHELAEDGGDGGVSGCGALADLAL